MARTGLRSLFKRTLRRAARRLQTRAFALVGAAVAGFVVVMMTADLVSSHRVIQREDMAQTISTARIVTAVAAERLRYGRLSDLNVLAMQLGGIGAVARIEIHDARTGLTLETDTNRFLLKASLASDTARRTLASGAMEVDRIGDVVEVALPIMISGELRGVVGVRSSDDTQVRKRNEAILRSLVIGAVFLAVLLPLLGVIVRGLVKPIQDLTAATNRIARGELDVPVGVGRSDEIGRLASSFRRMIRRLKHSIAEEKRLAYVDHVTGLANRERIRRAVASIAGRAKADRLPRALFFIDLDGFKRVNDVFGHDRGDKLLAAVGERFGAVCRASGLVLVDALAQAPASETRGRFAILGRIGGDEFVLAARFETDDEQEPRGLGEALVAAVAAPFVIDGQVMQIGASIGVARLPHHGEDARTLMRHADLAMYEAKDRGGNRVCIFSDELSRKVLDRMVVEMELRRAVGLDEIEVYYMPKVRLDDGSLAGFEALARWRSPTRGLVPSGVFVPIAEETGLVTDLDRIVMRKATAQAAAWAARGWRLPVAMNVSAAHLERPDFVDAVHAILGATGLDPRLLELEITESTAMRDPERAIAAMTPLKAVGVRFAIDDFGTGYSNLAQLNRIPADVFKIDRSFVASIDLDYETEVLVRTIVALARQLGLETVAEGIETEAQAELLAALGCSIGQGFLYGRPMPLGEAEEWLADHDWERAAEAPGPGLAQPQRTASG